jgi:hypothetical protein
MRYGNKNIINCFQVIILFFMQGISLNGSSFNFTIKENNKNNVYEKAQDDIQCNKI